MIKIASTIFLLLLAGMLHAGPRTSTNYSITTDSNDGGGKRNASVSYSNDGSVGGVTGLANAVAPAQTVKSGYLGQIYEVTAVQVTAMPATLNEAATRQLAVTATLDDGSTLASLAGFVTWSPSPVSAAAGSPLLGTCIKIPPPRCRGVTSEPVERWASRC